MGDNNNTVPNLSHLVSSGDSSGSQGEQQTKAQSASERDVVDTFWDIPLITFSEVESAVERGEASDAAYAQAAATSMTAATSSTPVSDAPTVNLRVEDFPNIAGKHISGAENDSASSCEPDSTSSSTATLDFTQSADASPSAESAERTVAFASPVGPAASADSTMPFFVDSSASASTAFIPESLPMPDDLSDMENDEHDPLRLVPVPPKKSHRKTIIITVAIVAIVALVAAGVGFGVWQRQQYDRGLERNEQHRTALSMCQKSSKAYEKAMKEHKSALKNAKALQNVKSDQVSDAKTLTALQSAVKDAQNLTAVGECSADLSNTELRQRSKAMNEQLPTLQSQSKNLNDSATAVTNSQKAKEKQDNADALKKLETAINNAQALLDNSLYQVADDSTRVTLQSAIDHALELFNGNSTDTNAINQSITDLQTASDDVNASMNALAAQQQQQQQSNTGNSYNYQYTRQPSGGLTPSAPITPGNNPGSGSNPSTGSNNSGSDANPGSNPSTGSNPGNNGSNSGSGSDSSSGSGSQTPSAQGVL
ncbi:BAR domain-containing protein [Bifidobacterium pseudocatenulatum]|uniref:hypothetical protein n=1 Tax=Bifidobacterium pseudocatenulatum TaxID=28026 RepID=UPI00080B9D2E|nr:hypothetical protein [Bifidobacterium pseudocatenulatum]UDG84438.1 hypothetical protein KYE71_08265 [Bifidobacterium pseudocatenulatum]UDG86278.1 hypothetical protein KYE72_08495 [Bifidobacterium pseudocatenulatum]